MHGQEVSWAFHNCKWWLVPLSATSQSASFLRPCETHLWTLLHWLRFHNRLLSNGKKERQTPLLQLKQYGFSSVLWGKAGYVYTSCSRRAKMRLWKERSENCSVPVRLSIAVQAWPPVIRRECNSSSPLPFLPCLLSSGFASSNIQWHLSSLDSCIGLLHMLFKWVKKSLCLISS